jgi:hypothetical protein
LRFILDQKTIAWTGIYIQNEYRNEYEYDAEKEKGRA